VLQEEAWVHPGEASLRQEEALLLVPFSVVKKTFMRYYFKCIAIK